MKSVIRFPLGLLAFSALAQAAGIEDKVASLETAVKSAQSAGDNAWMLISSALVLMMTGPGLALFYGGLVRRKNVLGTMMQSFILMARDHGPVGAGWLQPGLRRKARRSSADLRLCSS